jgi:hypothetical protein
MKAAMIALILCAALLTAVMLSRPDWLTPESQPRPSAARPWAECVYPADPRVAQLDRLRGDKEEVALRLFHGELTLLEAAERFYHINGSPAGPDDGFLKVVPGRDNGERLCNQAISWVGTAMYRTHPPTEVAARVAVLKRELQDHVALHGGVQLPQAE